MKEYFQKDTLTAARMNVVNMIYIPINFPHRDRNFWTHFCASKLELSYSIIASISDQEPPLFVTKEIHQ